ncbi:hypothetical protein ACHAWF_016474 [Thalassiosira exigua]
MGSTSSKQRQSLPSLKGKRQQSKSSRLITDSALPNRSRMGSTDAIAIMMPPKKQSRRAAALKSFRGSVANAIRRPRVVTCNDGEHSRSSSTATESSSNTVVEQLLDAIQHQDQASLPPTQPAAEGSSNSSEQPQTKGDSRPATVTQEYHIMPQVKLGYGVAGEVRQCIHRSTSSVCAIKTMDKSRIRRQDRIKREINFLRQIQHPNIVRLYDVYEDDTHVHLITELCRGGELFDRIVAKARSSKNARSVDSSVTSVRTKPPACFHERDAAWIVHSILSAVAYLHSKDIVHRDIKPENILFADSDDESPVKLIDFGLSIRHAAESRPLTSAVGTPYYMAPELLDGCYDRSCDLWSIGVITYILLTGRPPFNGRTDNAIFKNTRSGQYKMEGHGLSNQAEDFIRRLLDLDPNRRWSADMAMDHAWFSFWG